MLLATLPARAVHANEIASHPFVDQVRLNTMEACNSTPRELLNASLLKTGLKPLHMDINIKGGLNNRTREFIQAAKRRGLRRYMLTGVEREQDVLDFQALVKKAEIIIKIDSRAGLEFVQESYHKFSHNVHLMVARDTLYTSLKHDKIAMLNAERLIVDCDHLAIAAFRILPSLEQAPHKKVSQSDLNDLEWLHYAGYKNFLLSDSICLNRDAFHKAIVIFSDFQSYYRENVEQVEWPKVVSM